MQNIKYLFIIFCIGLASIAIGQDKQQFAYHDVIYIEGGSILRGTIIEYDKDKSGTLKFELLSGALIDIQLDQIKKITNEPIKYKKEKGARKVYEFQERGLYHFSSFHISMANDAFRNDLTLGAGIHHISGFKFNRWLGAGLGVGIDYYYPGSGETFTPVYAEVRGYTKAANFSPMYSIAAGYGFTSTNENTNIVESKGGLMFYPSIGFRMGGNPNANFTLDFGMKIQKGTFTYDWGWELREQRMLYQRFIIRTGILF